MSKLCGTVLFLIEVFILYGNGKNAVDSFTCSITGQFPDPNDCAKFYDCQLTGSEAYLMPCPSRSPIYNPVNNRCMNITNRAQIASLCRSSITPTPRISTSVRSLKPSGILPSSSISVTHSRYTTTPRQLVTTSSFSDPKNSHPTVEPIKTKHCGSVALEEMFKCFENEAGQLKESMARNKTASILDILQTTAEDADDVLGSLTFPRNGSSYLNAFKIVSILEDLWKEAQKRLANSSEIIRIFTKSFLFESANINGEYRFPQESLLYLQKQMHWDELTDQIQLPRKLLSEGKYPCRSVGALYSRLHAIVPVRLSDTNETLRLNSHVISMSLCMPVKHKYQRNILIILKHLKALDENEYTYCAFWNFSKHTIQGRGAWSRDGCHVVTERSNRTHTVCACGHLTNFAVLMGSGEYSVPKADKFALGIITYVGCILSLFGAVGAITSFAVFTQLNTDRHIIHGNLLVSIAISQTIFLFGIEQTENELQCKFTAIMLHYFYLVSFGWMLCEGLHLYTMVVKVFNLSSKIYHYIVLAWGIPALLVLVTAACMYSDYGTKTSCWISPERNTLLAFIIPVAVTTLANIVILGLVLHEICRLHTTGRTCMSDVVRSTLKSLVVLFPLLGVTWLFGLLVFATHSVAFQYLFALSNTMQGFFIFLLHSLFNSEIRKNFKRKKETWKAIKAIRFIRKRLSGSSVVTPLGRQSSLSEKASTFKPSSAE